MVANASTEIVSVGYAQTSVQKGENASIVVREFTSSEDGDLFISRLEGIPSDILAALPDRTIKPSSVDRFLAVIRPDHHATVYLNDELKLLVTFTIKGKDIEAGEAVFSDNIADIQQVTFHGISVPEDTGIVFVFSQGWRKGFYFDLVPLIDPSFTPRNYDLTKLLGKVLHISFFSICSKSRSQNGLLCWTRSGFLLLP